MLASFRHGDIVRLEVSGKLEVMASSFLKVVLENMDGFADDPDGTKGRVCALIDDLYSRLYDPDLDDLEIPPFASSGIKTPSAEQEHRSFAVINDRLHDVSLPMIPLIVKYFACKLHIGFELPDKGVFFFTTGLENNYTIDSRIVELDIPVGIRMTIIGIGPRGKEAGIAVRNVLQNLWQCDQWLRSRAGGWNSETGVSDLMKYAREMERNSSAAYDYVRNPLICTLITQSISVNSSDRQFSKREGLEQLARSHALVYDLQIAEVLKRVEEVENKQVIVPRPGFAIAHAAMDRSPRIAISFGVYPSGITWSHDYNSIKLVAMVLYARDTFRTWADYRRKFGILFRSVPNLQRRLVESQTSADFIDTLRAAEFSLVKG